MRSLDKSAAADRKPDCRYFNALSRPVKFTRQTSEDQASIIVLTAKRRQIEIIDRARDYLERVLIVNCRGRNLHYRVM